MGKQWDYDVPDVDIWTQVHDVLKPGAHLLSFFGSRTYHRGAIPIEDAGFEIRDQLMWLYGSGFPKSHNVGKAVDKLQGNQRKGFSKYEGWGTALKPAHEPIVMARKPIKGTVAENVLEHGTGGINIDECRVETNPNIDDMLRKVERKQRVSETWKKGSGFKNEDNSLTGVRTEGRFPANVMHDGSDNVQEIFKDKARYFYCPKASKKDRDEGLDALPSHFKGTYAQDEWSRNNMGNTPDNKRNPVKNIHPTVKPTELMQYLCRLVTPKGGVVLDPFMGSGSTGKAAIMSGFKFVGIELNEEYFEIACARVEDAHKGRAQELF
jgi:site-specific DNA-methyltransferase (adenine-specific)